MQTPTFLPDALLYCKDAASDDEVYALLVQKPTDLIAFFETAADDETWSENHADLMAKLLAWITKQVADDRLAKELHQRALIAYRKHSQLLGQWIEHDITLALSDAKIPGNTFLLSASSDIFKDLLQKVAAQGEKTEIGFPEINQSSFAPILAFINTGAVPNLQTTSQEDLYQIIRKASAWNLELLSDMAEQSLKKYLTPQNCIELLRKALSEGWLHFARLSCEYINSKEWGIRLELPNLNAFTFEFLDFNENAMERFSSLRDIISELVCSGSLTENPQFGTALKSCPLMKTVNISNSEALTDPLHDIPVHLQALNVAECAWINKDTLKQLHKICPHLEKLIVSSNVQLNYTSWAEVTKFNKLKSLDVSLCRQFQDEDLRIILNGLRALRDLSLRKCGKINETGFLELAKGLPRLAFIDLSGTNVSDTAIVEIGSRCPLLVEITLAYCARVTEKGILSLVKIARSLREIDLSHCNISEKALQECARIKPNLIIRQ